MTETAQKLRQKIQSAHPVALRGADDLDPDNETIINNIQTISRDPRRDSVHGLGSGSQVSKREREILRGSGKGSASLRSPATLGPPASKSPGVGGGIRSQDRRSELAAAEPDPAYASGPKPFDSADPGHSRG
jgi:hypothetical protein